MGFRKESARFLNPYQKVIYKDAIYHIVQRAPGKDLLFVESKDYLYFIHLLKESKAKFCFDVYSFCLMPNHLHLLLKINNENLSEGMRWLFMKYALYFNNKYKRKGHVFYGNYRAFLCLDEDYLLTASVYIHLNPYKAKLVSYPSFYRWSSLSAYLKIPPNTFINYRYILDILHNDLSKASWIYSKILEDSKELNFKNIIEDIRAVGKFSFHFLKRVRMVFQKNKIQRNGIEFKIEEFKDKRRLRKPKEVKARRYLIEQLRSRGYTIGEIAEMLSLSRQTVYSTLRLKE